MIYHSITKAALVNDANNQDTVEVIETTESLENNDNVANIEVDLLPKTINKTNDLEICVNENHIENIVKQVLGSEATIMFTAEMSTEIANKVQSSIIDFLNKKEKTSKSEEINDKYWSEHDDYYMCTSSQKDGCSIWCKIIH